MTENENKMLEEMYKALMVPQRGHKEALITRMENMSRDWQRMGWAARGVLFILLTFGSVLAAWDKIAAWARGGG